MQDLLAYALRADFEGTINVELEDGSKEKRDVYQGGLLAVGDSDFDVKAELDKGAGTIVVHAGDQQLVDLLDVYPALKRSTVPDKPKAIVSPYGRRPVETLRHLASLRDIDGPIGRASKAKLVAALEAQDAAQIAGLQGVPDAITVPDSDDGAAIDVAELNVDQLGAVLANDQASFAAAGEVEIPAVIDELRGRAKNGDEAASAVLGKHDINPEA